MSDQLFDVIKVATQFFELFKTIPSFTNSVLKSTEMQPMKQFKVHLSILPIPKYPLHW